MKNDVRTTRRGQAARSARRAIEFTYDAKAMRAWVEAERPSAAATDAAERFEMAVIDSGKGKAIAARADADGVALYRIVVAIDIDARKSNRSMDKGFRRLVDQYAEGGGGEVRQDSYHITLEPKSRVIKLTSSSEQENDRLVAKTEKDTRQQALDQLRNALAQVKAQARGDAALRQESAELLEGALSELRTPAVEDWAPAEEELGTGTEPHKPMMTARETIERLKELREPGGVQAFLDRFVVGKTYELFEDNYLVASGVTEHLRDLKLRVKCQRDSNPSYLRCKKTTGNEAGSFYFEHYTDGQQWTHGGYPVMPTLEVVPAPPRRGRESADTQEIGLTHPTT